MKLVHQARQTRFKTGRLRLSAYPALRRGRTGGGVSEYVACRESNFKYAVFVDFSWTTMPTGHRLFNI